MVKKYIQEQTLRTFVMLLILTIAIAGTSKMVFNANFVTDTGFLHVNDQDNRMSFSEGNFDHSLTIKREQVKIERESSQNAELTSESDQRHDLLERHSQLLDGTPLIQEDSSMILPMKIESEGSIHNEATTTWNLGDTKQFMAYNFTDSNNPYYVNATLRAAAERALIWVDDRDWLKNVTQEDANYLATTFTEYYPVITQFFGEPKDVDGDGVINVSILLTDIDKFGVAGYFWDHGQSVNGLTMFYLDNEAGVEGIYDDTMVHEYQHAIHGNLDPDEDRWINEGASDFAVLVSGLLKRQNNWTWKVPYFEDLPGTSLTYWDYSSSDHDVRIDYAKSYLFMVYLAEHHGGDQIIRNLVKDTNNGVSGVQSVLNALGGPSFQQVFNDWVIALYLDRPDINDGRYGYQWLDLNMSYAGYISSNATISGSLDDYGFSVYLLENDNASGTWNVAFNGDATTSFNVTLVPLYGNGINESVSISLDANNDGTASIPAYPKVALFVMRNEGSNGADGVSPEKSYTLTVNYVPDHSLRINDDVNITIQNHQLELSHVLLLNGSTPITTPQLAEVSIFDSGHHFSGLGATLSVSTLNSSQWNLKTPLDISLLPVGNYHLTITFVINGIAIVKSFEMVISVESTTIWTVLLDDSADSGLDPSQDIRNITMLVDYSANLVMLRMSLAGIPDWNAYVTGYRIYLDINNDSWSDLVIYQSKVTGNVHSYMYNYNTSDYFPIFTQILGNSIIFKVSLTFFASFQAVSLWGKTLRIIDSAPLDSTFSTELNLFGAPVITEQPESHLQFYEGLTRFIELRWTVVDNNPDKYLVLVNGSLNASGTWTPDTPIIYNFTSFTIGTYNITLILNDTTGNQVLDTVLVDILPVPDTTAPTITGSSGTISITQGDSSFNLSWTMMDENPSRYLLYINETVVLDENWDTSPQTIDYPLNHLSVGRHVFNLTAWDRYGNKASVVVIVIVTAPTSSTTTGTSTAATTTTTETSPVSTSTTSNGNSVSTTSSSTSNGAGETTTSGQDSSIGPIASVNTFGFRALVTILSLLGLLAVIRLRRKKMMKNH